MHCVPFHGMRGCCRLQNIQHWKRTLILFSVPKREREDVNCIRRAADSLIDLLKQAVHRVHAENDVSFFHNDNDLAQYLGCRVQFCKFWIGYVQPFHISTLATLRVCVLGCVIGCPTWPRAFDWDIK